MRLTVVLADAAGSNTCSKPRVASPACDQHARPSCVVTGGARGIGRGIAELMVARGHHVVIGDLDGAAAAATAAEIGAVAGLAQDVRDPDAHRVVAAEAARHGG